MLFGVVLFYFRLRNRPVKEVL